MRRQRGGINNPGVRDEMAQPIKEAFAQLLTPKALEISVPEQGEKHFLFENGFRRRSKVNAFFGGERKDFF